MTTSTILASTIVVVLFAAPAAAEDRIGGGLLFGRPIAGDAGGGDYALAARWEHVLAAMLEDAELDVGVAVQIGYAPGNTEESLTRFALLPTVGMSTRQADLVLRADLALGWQVANGQTTFGGVPAQGTEARCIRGELGLGIAASVTVRVALRARAGLVLDGVYPSSLRGSTKLGPFVELGVGFTL